jgi:hypothetical protein
MELKKNSCEEKLQITQVSYSFPLSGSSFPYLYDRCKRHLIYVTSNYL